MHTTFVILHYLTEQDTIECINSIQDNITNKDYNIIVVDNASTNDTGENLSLMFKNNSKVDIILSKENLGFARGNNLGFKKAKYEYQSDFIILLNNDTYIEQEDFLDVIIKKYQSEEFAVLGPDIISIADGGHQNPVPIVFKKRYDVIHQMIKLILLLTPFSLVLRVRGKVKRMLNKEVEKISFNTDKDMIDVQLHGSCLIFSEKYIEKFDGLYDKTFMFVEEDILRFFCEKEELKMMYTPDLLIYHKEDSATDELFRGNIESGKRKFKYKHSLHSMMCLYHLMGK